MSPTDNASALLRAQTTTSSHFEKIRQALQKHLADHQEMPTMHQLMDRTKLSEAQILNAVKQMPFNPATHYMRCMTDKLIHRIYENADSGNVASQKLWLQLMESWVPPKADTTESPLSEQDDTKLRISHSIAPTGTDA
jgi:hypothetical protein